jgi:2-iminobutanoate/2-iminopropanoate deaminase
MRVHGAGLKIPSGDTLPLSSAVEAEGLVFFSGQLAMQDGKIPDGIEAQTNLILDILDRKLADQGLSLDNVAKSTVWLADAADFARFNSVYRQRLSEPYPARSCVVSALLIPRALIEIEIVAARTPRSDQATELRPEGRP